MLRVRLVPNGFVQDRGRTGFEEKRVKAAPLEEGGRSNKANVTEELQHGDLRVVFYTLRYGATWSVCPWNVCTPRQGCDGGLRSSLVRLR